MNKPTSKRNPKQVVPLATEPAEDDDVQEDAIIGKALWGSLAIFAAVGGAIALALWIYAMRKPAEQQVVTQVAQATKRELVEVELPRIPLIDVTNAAGIDFVYYTGREGQRLLPETMGGGGGFIDYNNDGYPDIFLVNGNAWPWAKDIPDPPPTMKLYENDGKGNFRDVTKDAGLDKTFYGMGPAFGDFDNDGWVDIYVTAVGRNFLFRNHQGTFVDVTEEQGVAGSEEDWSCPAMWFDFDRDGKLDLLVGNYVQWSREIDLQQGFTVTGVGRAYGQPTNFAGSFLRLYRNHGQGFEDVSDKSGMMIRNPNTNVPNSKCLALAIADVNHDGWPDVVVANDTVQNFLLLNRRDGTFIDIGVQAGIAFDRFGNATGAMGVDCAHYRNDENLAIAIGNFANEPSSFFVSRGKTPQFFDAATPTGFGPQTLLRLTFGMMFSDMDLDGRLDIICTNGHLEEEIAKIQPTQRFEQASQLFWNAGRSSRTEFVELGEREVGKDFLRPIVGRGSAFADIDGDGDVDLLLMTNGGPVHLLRNDQRLGHHWLRVVLKGTRDNRDAIGSEVILRGKDFAAFRCVTPTRSYLSQSELAVTFGLGKLTQVEEIEIIWPSGGVQRVPVPDVDRTITIEQER